MLERVVREAYRREQLPPLVLWTLAADGMHAWYAMLRKGLTPLLGSRERAEEEIAKAAAIGYRKRWDGLRERHPQLAHGDAARVLGALSMVARDPKRRAWPFRALEGQPPTRRRDHLAVEWTLREVPVIDRWHEVTTHLGEILIALTQTLPQAVPTGANAALGQICFEGGRASAEQAKRIFALPDRPESAIEVLRMSEYVFRVNPHHWHEADATANTGMIEGTACPWFTSPGWSMMHCGIFGQFQAGISSVFGLRYQLTKTIPKHGGTTCRIDLRPLKRKDGSNVALPGSSVARGGPTT